MKNMVISLALGAGAIFASSTADAAPLTKGLAMLPNDNIENVRLVCDQYGRCYRTHGGRRVIIQQGYGGDSRSCVGLTTSTVNGSSLFV